MPADRFAGIGNFAQKDGKHELIDWGNARYTKISGLEKGEYETFVLNKLLRPAKKGDFDILPSQVRRVRRVQSAYSNSFVSILTSSIVVGFIVPS